MFLSIVFFITGLLGFLTITVVMAQYEINRKVNFYFLVLLFFISVRFFFNGVYVLVPFKLNENLGLFYRSFGGVIFPCVYLYFKNLIVNKKNPTQDELRYFIVPVLFGFFNLLIHIYVPSWNLYCYFLFLAIVLFYLSLAYLELKNKLWFKKSKFTIIERQKVLVRNWSFFFFTICVLMIIRLMVSLLLDIYVAGFSNGTNFLWISAIISFCLFFKVLMTNETLFNAEESNDKQKVVKYSELVFHDLWVLTDEKEINSVQDLKLKERIDQNLMTYIHEVERVALEDFCFRNSVVTLSDFAIQLKIPKSHLIYLFKYHADISFVGFKRVVQIYDAINLIEEGYLGLSTLELLSKKVGFSSYDLFFSNFKEIAGVFPDEYNVLIKAI